MHVLLVGLGNMGMKYLAKLEELQELPVLCDIDPYKNIGKHPFYCHFGEIKESVVRAIVAVNPEDHVEVAGRLLSEGVPVLLEKPPALSSKEFALIADDPNLEISEIELYSFPVKSFPKDIRVKEIRAERLNRGRGYINPLWDLAWHDLYVLQYLFGDVEVSRVREGEIWELEGSAAGVPFTLRVAWEHRGEVRRRWTLRAEEGEVIMDFLREEITFNGHIRRRSGGDKLKEMVSDFLRGSRRRGSTLRAMRNLKILEKIS